MLHEGPNSDKSIEDFLSFSRNHSLSEKHSVFNAASQVYIRCPETDYFLAQEKLKLRGGIYVGIAGSVTPAFGHISEIEPYISILADVNEYCLDYLLLRSCLVSTATSGMDYWRKLGALLDPEEENLSLDKLLQYGLPELTAVRISEIIQEFRKTESIRRSGTDSSGNNIKQLLQQTTDQLAVFAKLDSSKTFKMDPPLTIELQKDCLLNGWSSKDRFEKVKNAWGEGRINGVTLDFDKALELAFSIAERENIYISGMYLSNIDTYRPAGHGDKTNKLIQRGLKSGFVHPEAQIICWKKYKTEVIDAKEFV